MAKVRLSSDWCPECYKKALDKVDIVDEASETIETMKRKLLVAFMIGDKDGAIAECCYHLGITPGELSVAGPFESPKLDRKMALAIAQELAHKFPDILEALFERMGFYERMKEREERRRREMEFDERRLRRFGGYRDYEDRIDFSPLDRSPPVARYIPPHNPFKKNQR